MACTSHHIVHTHTQPQPLWLCPSPHHHSLVCVCMETRATWPCNAPQCLCAQHLTPQSTQPSVLSMCADVCCQMVLVHHLHAIIVPFRRATMCFIHTLHGHHPCVSDVLSSIIAFTSVGLLEIATLNLLAHHSHPSRWLCIALRFCFSSSNNHSGTIVG